jgi:DNA-binding transcriptional ArsR family regulator
MFSVRRKVNNLSELWLSMKTNHSPQENKSGCEEVETTNAIFAALSHPSRRQILRALRLEGGRMTAGEIAHRFSCTWPTTTKHLHALESAGLVRVEKSGRERVYYLEADFLLEVTRKWLRWFEEGV